MESTNKPRYVRKDPEKRQMQNRKAQAAARERKKRYVEALEQRIAELSSIISSSESGTPQTAERPATYDRIKELETRNKQLKDSLEASRMHVGELQVDVIGALQRNCLLSQHQNNDSSGCKYCSEIPPIVQDQNSVLVARIVDLQLQKLEELKKSAGHCVNYDLKIVSAVNLYGAIAMTDLESCWGGLGIPKTDLAIVLKLLKDMFSSTSITAMRQVLMKHSLQRSKILDNLGIISRNLYVDAQEAFFANHKQHANYMYTLAFSFKPMSSIPITSPLHDALLLELGPLLDKLSEIPSLTDKSHLIINMLTSFVQFELAPTNETREDWFFAYGFSINSIFKICVDPAERKNVLTVVEMGRAKAHAFISKNNIQRAEFLIDMQSDSIPTNNPVEIDDHIASCVDLYGPIDLSDLESCWSSIPIRLEDLRETLGLIRTAFSSNSKIGIRNCLRAYSTLKSNILDSLGVVDRHCFVEGHETFLTRYPHHKNHIYRAIASLITPASAPPFVSLNHEALMKRLDPVRSLLVGIPSLKEFPEIVANLCFQFVQHLLAPTEAIREERFLEYNIALNLIHDQCQSSDERKTVLLAVDTARQQGKAFLAGL